jgi:hypothetical protein
MPPKEGKTMGTIGCDHEATGSDRRVADSEVGLCSGVGLHALDDRLNEDARREVLPSLLLPFGSGLPQGAFIRSSLDIYRGARPIDLRR